MRIQASAGRKGDIRDGVRKLTLTADSPFDRAFATAVYRIIGPDRREDQEAGVVWMREYLKSFPPFED